MASDEEPVFVLSLDGGGIRGVSELVILQEIMTRLRDVTQLDEMPKPCDYFHLIGGTSTGGLIAVMLGRLRMSVDEAISQYKNLAKVVFSKKNRSKFDRTYKEAELDRLIKDVVQKSDRGTNMLAPDDGNAMGHSFVCAVPGEDSGEPYRFRSYSLENRVIPDCLISEACLATTAAPTYFRPVTINLGVKSERFIDGAMRCNNPSVWALREAEMLYGSDRQLGFLLSLGTGTNEKVMPKPGLLDRIPTWSRTPFGLGMSIRGLSKYAKLLLTDTERTHSDLSIYFRRWNETYFRFNVPQGASGVELDEYQKIDKLMAKTKQYLKESNVSERLDIVVDILRQRRSRGITLGQACSVPGPGNSVASRRAQPRGRSSYLFTGRETILGRLDDAFRPSEASRRKEHMLCGMGGVGKTEIVLKFIEDRQDWFHRVFWIDASDSITMKESFRGEFQKFFGPNETADVSACLEWLATSDENWLLHFDNCPDVDISPYLPQSSNGNILFSTRYRGMKPELAPGNITEVEPMSSSEAVDFIFAAIGYTDADRDTETISQAQALCKDLGYLPLAIDQAGAYMRNGRHSLPKYHEQFREHREEMLKRPVCKGVAERNIAVYATFELSHKALNALATGKDDRKGAARSALQILTLFACWHNEGLMEETLKRAALSEECRREVDFGGRVPPGSLPQELLNVTTNAKWDDKKFQDGVTLLMMYSLIKPALLSGIFSMHILIHAWGLERMEEPERKLHLRAARTLLFDSFAGEDADYFYYHKAFIHIQACLAKDPLDIDENGEQDAATYAMILENAGMEREAEPIFEKIMEIQRRTVPFEPHCYLWALSKLADNKKSLGRLDEAEKHTRELMELRTLHYGPEHKTTLEAKSILAAILNERYQFSEALGLCQEVIEGYEGLEGSERNMVNPLNEMVMALRGLKRWEEALECSRRLMRFTEDNFGRDHSISITARMKYAGCLDGAGDSTEALKLLLDVVHDFELHFGRQNPDTIMALSYLSDAYKRLGNWADAEAAVRDAMVASLRLQGEEHPHSIHLMTQLAKVLLDSGFDAERWLEAMTLLDKSGEQSLRLYGSEYEGTKIIAGMVTAALQRLTVETAQLEQRHQALLAGHEGGASAQPHVLVHLPRPAQEEMEET